MTVPVGMSMSESGTQTYNLPVRGKLAPGESTSFKMPPLNPGVSTPGYGDVNYSFMFLYLVTDVTGATAGKNIWFKKVSDDGMTSLSNVPTTDIILQYAAPQPQ